MIGRLLTPAELAIVTSQAERLLTLKFLPEVEACLQDDSFAAFPEGWQLLIVSDMRFLQGELALAEDALTP